MRRRDAIVGLGAAALARPLAARAQQPPARPTIGFLRSGPIESALVMSFRQGLNETGYIEGRNVDIEYRSAENHLDRLTPLVTELIRRPVAVIVGNVVAALAAKAATTTVPIIFVSGSDPVNDGLLTSLNRPGGNVTGVAFLTEMLAAKRIELLRQLVPTTTTIAALLGPETPDVQAERRDVRAIAQAIDLSLVVVIATNDHEIEEAFATIVQRRAGALLVGSGSFMFSHRDQVVALAARHGVPAMYSVREFVAAGGLMSYGGSITEAYRQAGIYAARILRGESPADMPVMQSSRFELAINLRAARALNLSVPNTLLVIADEVIE